MESLFSRTNIGYAVTLLFCSLMYLTVFLPKDSFIWLTLEDGLLESTAALLFLITAVLFFMLFFRKKSFASEEVAEFYGTRSKRVFFFLLGLLFVFLLGEEISWGQRIFGWDTPEGMAEDNMQGETTLHNLKWFHPQETEAGADVHVKKTGIAALLTAKKIFVYIFVCFLFLLPLGVRFVPFIRDLVRKFYVPVPVVQLGILFIVNVLLFKAFKPLTGDYREAMRGLGEIEEFNFAVILFLIPFVWLSTSSSNSKTELASSANRLVREKHVKA